MSTSRRSTYVIMLVLGLLLVLAVSVASLGAAPQAAQAQEQSYIVIMQGMPIAAYEGGEVGLPATKPGKGNKINPNSAHVRKYDQYLKAQHKKALDEVGVSQNNQIHTYTVALNGFSAMMTAAEAEQMALRKDVTLVLEDVMRYPQTDSSPSFLGLTAPGGAWSTGVDGEGVIVGVIDSGIWPEHPSFADDGTFPLAPALDDSRPNCEFGNISHNSNDAAFTCNNKLVGARQMLDTYRAIIGAEPDEFDSARDDNGHGTHTASTAAGNAGVEASMYGIPRGTISGIAPRSQVIAYKALGNLGGFTSDLAAAIDQAVADGVDVINYSIGGGAAGPGADEIAFLFAADAGVHVATSAGNNGPGASTLGNPATMPWLTTVGANTQSRFWQGTAVLGDGTEIAGASITPGVNNSELVDAEDHGGDLCVPGTLDSGVAGKIVLCRRGAIDRTDKSLAVYIAGGTGMIMYNNSDDDNLFSDTHWVPSVHIDNTPGLAVKDYIAESSTPTATIIGEQVSEWTPAPSMTIFSSRGPNPSARDIIKPDITAPGHQILAGNSPFPDPGSVPGELFQAIAGTSMSSPHIAGLFALLHQDHPDWSPAMTRSALMTTAYQDVRDNDRVSPADPFDMGSGHANPGAAVQKGSAFQPGLVYDAGFLDYFGFLCDAFPEIIANPVATCAFLESVGIPIDASDLNYPSIGVAELAGTQTVQRTVTSVAQEEGWRDYSVSVDPPPGYSVSVSPSTLRLKSGDSATYYVTITNHSAPIGEWRFGSLTWSDAAGHYDVYSPIAVKASPFDAPDEINGSGASGSASFDVNFGYTGSYSAAPHGLAAATVTSGNVIQDPDQNFSPSDGYSNLHQFALSGAAHFRIAMPPEATEANADLDIYVFDPNGSFAASSTSGGTDELIDIPMPMDGTWNVFVHGWSAPGGDSDYDMWTWEVPLAPGGGSLVIDSAPTSATLSTTGTIDVSWSGLSTGSASSWYLGAVSHTGDTGLMGLTFVNVDNRP